MHVDVNKIFGLFGNKEENPKPNTDVNQDMSYLLEDFKKHPMFWVGMFKKLIYMITQMDLVANNAFTSCKYHYCKPMLNSETNESFINVKQFNNGNFSFIFSHHDVSLFGLTTL